MSEIEGRFRIQLDGKDELRSFFRGTLGEIKEFETDSARAMAGVNRALSETGKEFLRFGATAARTALQISGLNFGIANQARGVLEFRDSINRLATAANLAEGQIGGLKDQVLDISVATGQMKESVTDALGAFVAKTGDIKTARENLLLYAQAATATGASLKDVAEIGAQLSQKFGIKNQSAALGILAKQGDIGAIELKDLATQGPRMFAAAASAGYTGEGGLRSAGALAQLFAEGVGGSGSAARVATSVENVFQSINQKQSKIEALGIPVGNRDPISIAEDIVKHFKGNVRDISAAKLFTSAGMRGIQTMALGYNDENGVHHAGYNESGKFEELEKYKNVGSVGIIDEKFRRNSSSGLSALNRAQAAIDRSTDHNLGDMVEGAAQHGGLVADSYDFVTSHLGLTAGVGAAGILAKNLIKNRVTGGGGGVLGGILGGGGDQRVFVTNWPAGMGPAGGAGNVAKTLLPAGALMGAVAAPAIVATAGLAAVGLHDTLLQGLDLKKASNKLTDDLASGRKRAVSHWYNFGGQSFEDVAPENQAAAAEEYRRRRKQLDPGWQGDAGMSSARGNAPAQEQIEVKPTINITIHDDKADADTDGTRAPEVRVKRGGR